MLLLLQWVVVVVTATCFVALILRFLRHTFVIPLGIQRTMHGQGVNGPPFKLFFGNRPDIAQMIADARSPPLKLSHDILSWVFPYYMKWSQIYGDTLLYWFDSQPILTISDPEMMKEVLSNKFGHFPKIDEPPPVRDLFGNGMVMANGEEWAKKRRILSHAFQIHKLKVMMETAAQITSKMLDEWECLIAEKTNESHVEVEVLKHFSRLTGDVIAHWAFGIDYEAGTSVFSLQRQQSKIVQQTSYLQKWPGNSFLPFPLNRQRWKLRKQIEASLLKIVESRLVLEPKSCLQQNDLLGLMLAAYKGELQGSQRELRLSIQDIVEECKTFFFAGYDTTASLISWTTMLLAMHPDWQEEVRREAAQVCKSEPPNNETLGQLKTLDMVMNETLRLYPPATIIRRATYKDVTLGKLFVPKGVEIHSMLLVAMRNKQLWGEDANEFNPRRFSEGIAKACKHRSGFLPFSIGPRNCIGQVFAMIEAKIVICMILQRFRFTLSPGYTHSPNQVGLLRPMQGVQIILSSTKPYSTPSP